MADDIPAAEWAASQKVLKYAALTSTHEFVPFAVETSGAWSAAAKEFISRIGRRMRDHNGDPKGGWYLVQRIALAIQRENAASAMGTLVEPETGAVFTFGRSRFADDEPSHFFIKNDPVVAISCGDEHSAVICQNGRVFVFGGNSWGQLGLGHKDEVTRPSCVKWLKPHRAVFVACGRAHTVFVTDTNAIYTVGCNDEGQLGTGDLEHHSVPQYVELGSEAPVRQVSAGSNHTAVLTDEGRVFVCGSNTEGQLGLGEDTRACSSFHELHFMEKIAFLECGYYHTVFITTKGAVFITGDNENNKLAIKNTAPIIYVPEVLSLDIPIKSACCGAAHTFLLSMDEAKILGFGSNDKGQLGLPQNVEYVTKPIDIDIEKMFDGYQLKLVACGAMHTAFVTDNGFLYTCGESRHNKLCLDPLDSAEDANVGNQYCPQRVTAMNGFVVDNVACGGCHTLLTATNESNTDVTNNDFVKQEQSLPMTELPPLKIPSNMKEAEKVNGKSDSASIDSLEANVSGSHIVNINDLDENGSIHDVPDINKDIDDFTPSAPVMGVVNSVGSVVDNAQEKIGDVIKDVKDTASELKDNVQNTASEITDKVKDTASDLKDKMNEKVEVVEDMLKKTAAKIDPGFCCGDEKRVLEIPDKSIEIQNSPPPKTPVLPELLQVPDLNELSPNLSKRSDDGLKSENEQSENETIPCGSDKSSPQAKTKTQAVMPILRSEDAIDLNAPENAEQAVENKIEEKGRFSRLFQSIKDKETSCMSKGKVIEEQVTEQVHKTIDGAEETVHKVEETVETEIRNHTNSRACTIL